MDIKREENIRREKLIVRMFGEFSMSYGGRALTGVRAKETYFIYMMQILIHNRENGVSRDFLEEVLFGDKDIEDRHHLMQSVIYNAKKKLRRWGLPDVNYIVFREGIFYWNEEIPVEEDAAEFDRIYRMAKESRTPEKRLEHYLEALHIYKGEFLSSYAGVLWAAAEARRYWEQFCECVNEAAKLMRDSQDYLGLEEMGRYVAAVNPFADWEILTMEALAAMGREEEAGKFYADTADLYLQKRGIRPSHKLMETMEKLGDQMQHPYEILERIQLNLDEDPENVTQGFRCSYPVFQGIYRQIKRMMERGGQSVYLMLCTLVDSKCNPLEDEERLKELSVRLGDAIGRSIRHGDVVNRYGKGQYLVLLINTTQENCELIQKRINKNFLKGRQRIGVQYHVNMVVCDT